MDPLAGSRWSEESTVEGFRTAQPNRVLLDYAGYVVTGAERLLDIGCGAGRNAVPLAERGWQVIGLDLSRPMLDAAADRARRVPRPGSLHLAVAPMDRLPIRSQSMDVVVAHGIWNLARTAAEFRAAVHEAARVAREGARLFVFTFSRDTLAAGAQPLPGETFVFTQFSGAPQCFLTEAQLAAELHAAGFDRDLTLPVTEYNRPRPGTLTTAPVLLEAAFRRRASLRQSSSRST